jgi:hypothetical protein
MGGLVKITEKSRKREVGHISVRWFVRIVTRENTTGVWLKKPTAVKREKDIQHAV